MNPLALQQFIQKLQQVHPELTANDIAEIFWLAMHIERVLRQVPITDPTSLSDGETAPTMESLPPQSLKSSQPSPILKKTSHSTPAPRAEVHSTSGRSDTTSYDYRIGRPVKSPTGAALPASLEIARSLRPLLRKVPSRTVHTMDVKATVRRIAETEKKVLMPVSQPALARWLDVALVVDTGASMIIWQKTIEELRSLLEHLGAFRDVRLWRLATDDKEQVLLYAGTDQMLKLRSVQDLKRSHDSAKQRLTRNPKELIDPGRQRLILIVTDCVSKAWHSGKVQELLQMWGQKNIVTIVQMLPQPLWVRTALASADIVKLHTSSAGCINARLGVRHSFSWFDDEPYEFKKSVPIPVFTLEPSSVGTWAKMITGVEGASTTGVIFRLDLHEEFSVPKPRIEMLPEKRVAQFRAISSSLAVKLAGLLAAAPISLPIMRLIQQSLLPGSSQIHLAEVFLSGLLKKVPHDVEAEDPDYVEYDFLPGVRERLLDPVSPLRSFEVLEKVASFIAQRYGRHPEFEALVVPTFPVPGTTGDIPISKESRPFALIAAEVWRRLGGNYIDWAEEVKKRAESGSGISSDIVTAQAVDDPEIEANSVGDETISLLSKERTHRKPESFIPFLSNPLFQERPSEFEQLEALLFDPKIGHPRIVAITGLAGIGKTQLTIELAYRYQDRFPGGVFWMPAIGKNLIDWRHQFADLAVKTNYLPLDDNLTSTENEQWRAEHFCRYVADHDDALLLLDNVEEPELVMSILPTLAGKEPTCSILYTSRNTNVPPGVLQYTVQALPEHAALRLLLETTRPELLVEVEAVIPFRRNPLFQERPSEFEQLEALLFDPKIGHPRIVAITGLAGIGKTQLTIELAYRYQDRFPGGVFWMPAKGKNLIDWRHQLADLAIRTNYMPSNDQTAVENEQRQAEHFCRYLADRSDALFILDDVEEPELVLSIFPVMAEREPACSILYNSCNTNVPPGVLQYTVQALPEQAALRLLLETTRPELLAEAESQRTNTEVQAARVLCQYVGYFPLALTLLRGLLARNKEMTPTALVKEFVQGSSLNINETLFQTLRLSWVHVDSQAQTLFKYATCFPEATPLFLWLLGIVSNLGENSSRLEEAYKQLCEMNFIEALAGEQVRLHPLVREFGRRMIQEEGDEEGRMKEEVIQRLTDEFVNLHKLEQRALQDSYWGCLDQVRIAYECIEMLAINRGELLKQIERWLAREGYLLADEQWWPELIPGLFYQQLYNHAVEGTYLFPLENSPEYWLHQEEAVKVEDQVLLQIFAGHSAPVLSVAFSPDGRQILTGSDDDMAYLWEVSNGRVLARLEGHKGSVWCVAFSPDGLLILTGSADRTVRLWNVESGREVQRLEGHRGLVSSVAFSPDGKRVITGSWDETVRIWDVESGRELEQLYTSNRTTSVAFSPDGQRILTGLWDGILQIWDVGSGEQLLQFEAHKDEISSVAFSPDGSRILSGSHDRTARVWNVKNGRELLHLEGHSSTVSSVAFSADGRWMLTGSWDETVRVWEATNGREFMRLEGHQSNVRSVAFAPDGKRVVSGSDDRTARLWEIESEQASISPQDQQGMIQCVSFSADGQRILTGTNKGMICIWDVGTRRELAQWREGGESVSSVAFSPNGQRMLVGTEDGAVSLWEEMPGRLIASLPRHKNIVTCVAFSPDGSRMLTSSRDGTVQLWGAEGQLKLLESPKSPGEAVTSAAFSADGRRILTGCAEGTVNVWDVRSGRELARLLGHMGPVNSVIFSHDGTHVLTSSDDGTARLWEITSQWQLAVLNGSEVPLRHVTFSPNDRYAVACDDHGWVFLWQLSGVDVGKLRGLYVASYKIGAIYWVDSNHLLLSDTGGFRARPHFYHLRLEGI